MKNTFCRAPFNYDTDTVSAESGLVCSDPTLAQQQFKEESDINNILKQFNITGQLPQGVSMPQYGDFSEVTDYHTALNLVIKADDAFMALPAHVRARFNNDAGELVAFVSDPSNNEEAQKLGLTIEKREQNLDPNPKDLGQKPSDSAAGA